MAYIRNDGKNPKLQIVIQPNIGLESDVRCSIVEILNHHLANETVLSLKTRSAHWNVNGAGFFELYTLFDTQYKQLNAISCEIAERIRMMGGFTIGSLQELIQYSRMDDRAGNPPDILDLLADHEASIRFLREDVRKCSEEFEDEGTFELLVSIVRAHEKMAWMLRSLIEPELSHDEEQNE